MKPKYVQSFESHADAGKVFNNFTNKEVADLNTPQGIGKFLEIVNREVMINDSVLTSFSASAMHVYLQYFLTAHHSSGHMKPGEVEESAAHFAVLAAKKLMKKLKETNESN